MVVGGKQCKKREAERRAEHIRPGLKDFPLDAIDKKKLLKYTAFSDFENTYQLKEVKK
jgi:hypothetical protein